MQSKNASRRSLAVTNFDSSPPLAASGSKSARSSYAAPNDYSGGEEEEEEQNQIGDLSAISQLRSSSSGIEENEPLPLPSPEPLPLTKAQKQKGKAIRETPPLQNNEELMQDLDMFDDDYNDPGQDDGELEAIVEEEEGEDGLVVLAEKVEKGKKGKGKAATVSPKSKSAAAKKRKWDSVEPEGQLFFDHSRYRD